MKFEDLLTKISPKLHAIAHKLNGRFTFFDEEDLYQEAILHLWKQCQSAQFNDKTDSFIAQNCYFFLRNHIRKIYKRVDANSIRLSDIMNNDDGNSNYVDNIFLEDTTDNIGAINTELFIEDICRNLSAREKKILDLCLEGLTTRQVGKRLGISHVMVIKIRKRIRKKCERYIK